MPLIPEHYAEIQERIVSATTLSNLLEIQDLLREILKTAPDSEHWIIESLLRNVVVKSWKLKPRK